MPTILEIVLPLAGLLGVMVGVILFLAFFVETLVEAILAPFFDHFPVLMPWKWLQMYIAVILGVVAAFLFKLDLIYLVGMFLSQIMSGADPVVNPITVTIYGIILTGLAIGKGSNYVHQLISKWAPKRPAAG